MATFVYRVLIVVAVFFLAGLVIPETRFVILQAIGNAWDALVRDTRGSGI